MKCPIHPTEELVEKDGQWGKFSSHRHGDGWCNGKVKQAREERYSFKAHLDRIEKKIDTLLNGQTPVVQQSGHVEDRSKNLPF